MTDECIDWESLKEPFPEKEISWRIGQVGTTSNGTWASCLAYLESRAVYSRLNDVLGPSGWKNESTVVTISPNLFGVKCRLSIWDYAKKDWVFKEDAADPTDTEGLKGAFSGAMKRAAVLWGVGLYLYDLDRTFAKILPEKKDGAHYQPKDKNGKYEAFYWLPPQLPMWARGEDTSGVRPDGEMYSASEKSVLSATITVGSYSRRRVSEVEKKDLEKQIGIWDENLKLGNLKMSGELKRNYDLIHGEILKREGVTK